MIFALLLHFVRNRTNVPYDTLVGVFLALALAVGAALLMYVARKINIHMLENVLFGSILTVTDRDITILAVSCLIILLLLIPTFNRILLTCISGCRACPWIQYQLLRLLVRHDDHACDNCCGEDHWRRISWGITADSWCNSPPSYEENGELCVALIITGDHRVLGWHRLTDGVGTSSSIWCVDHHCFRNLLFNCNHVSHCAQSLNLDIRI